MSTTLTGIQQNLQSTQNLAETPSNTPVPIFSEGTTFTDTTTVTTSVVNPTGSASVTEGTTADPAASYVGTNGTTPMFAIVNPRLPINPTNLNNPLAAPPILGSTPQGFNDNGTVKQGLIGNL